jgi:mannitol/fructose-specific phosphotransferase system IIA component (Ntr-type)
MKKFSEILAAERIKDLDSMEKLAALKELTGVIAKSDRIIDRDGFERAIIEREEILSTGIGFGIGIPHAKVDSVKDFVMAVGRSLQGIEFEAFDHEPVNIIVMIGASASQKDDYVRILAKVSQILKREEKRHAILAAETPQEIFEVFTSED